MYKKLAFSTFKYYTISVLTTATNTYMTHRPESISGLYPFCAKIKATELPAAFIRYNNSMFLTFTKVSNGSSFSSAISKA